MPAAFQSPLFRSHLACAMAGAVLACLAGAGVMLYVSAREEFHWHARQQVQLGAEQLAAHFGQRLAAGAISALPESAIGAAGSGLDSAAARGESVSCRVFVRLDGERDFRQVAGDTADLDADGDEVLGLARLGEAGYRIGPRLNEPAPARGERIARRMVVAAAGFRKTPESGVSVLALVRAPVVDSFGTLSSYVWGGLGALVFSLAAAAMAGGLGWASARGDLTGTESALRRVARTQGEHRLSVQRNDELGEIQEAINEVAAGWQEAREENRRLRAELSASAERVGVAEQAKSDFLANMSHEVRTPMNGILGTLSLLEETELEAAQRRLVQMARASGARLLRVINDILDYAKLESVEVKLERKRVCLEEVTLEVARSYAPAAAEKGVDVLVFVDPRLPANIEGDEVRLRQVLQNLVENAVKFTSRGEIRIELQAILRDTGRRYLQFSVRDTGMGISEAKQKQLFAAFSQQDNSTTRAFGGAGLGLAICRRLSQLHEGNLYVESEEGRGSSFTFEIPLRVWRGPVQAAEEEKIAVGARVGLLNPWETEARMLERYLKEWGMTPVLLAAGGASAELEGLQAILWNPAGAGEEISNRLRQAGARGVALLALRDPAAETAAFAPCRAEVPRPFGPSELRRALGEAIHPGAEPAAVVRRETPERFAAKYPARILVVEDQPMNQKIVQMMLQKLGYEVVIAGNGREGVEVVAGGTVDLVFMDLQMPVMGGIDATREIRGNFGLKRQPVIVAMTGYALSGVRESCMDAGMNDFLTKPLSVDDLREAIERNSVLLRAAA